MFTQYILSVSTNFLSEPYRRHRKVSTFYWSVHVYNLHCIENSQCNRAIIYVRFLLHMGKLHILALPANCCKRSIAKPKAKTAPSAAEAIVLLTRPLFCPILRTDIFSLKYESSIFRSVIQPCMWFLHDGTGQSLYCLAHGELALPKPRSGLYE